MAAALATLAGLATAALWGCGTSLPLPTEIPAGRQIPPDGSYQMVDTWTGMHDIKDLLLTQGTGSQLFILFNRGGVGSAPRGEVLGYKLKSPTPNGIVFQHLFNPVALASAPRRVFVLDQGDTCLARVNPFTGLCNGDTTGGWRWRVSNYELYWRVREYGLLGGDTISTFTDTTLAYVQGIAADDQGRVYVGGTVFVFIVDPNDSRLRQRATQFRVNRYVRRDPLSDPLDPNMPGATLWRRDASFVVEEGSGLGYLMDPRGLSWTGFGEGGLYAADFAKNLVQKLSDDFSSTGIHQLDGFESGRAFSGPTDVAVDRNGFLYALDTGTGRALRFGPAGNYTQIVNIERDAQGDSLLHPITIAVDDSLVYIGDDSLAKVVRYKRRD
jgi:hypothetical protein